MALLNFGMCAYNNISTYSSIFCFPGFIMKPISMFVKMKAALLKYALVIFFHF